MPAACPYEFPFRFHRTMAEVMAYATSERDANMKSWALAMTRTCPRCRAAPREQCRGSNGRLYGGIHTVRRVG